MGKSFLTITIPFFWAGLLVGISFLEAPLKFQAPGITLPLGLGIGQLVFTALNRVELLLALGLIWALVPGGHPSTRLRFREMVPYGLLFGLLAWQTFVLLPALNDRVSLYQQQGQPEPTADHGYYVAAEVVKLIALIWTGFLAVRKTIRQPTGPVWYRPVHLLRRDGPRCSPQS